MIDDDDDDDDGEDDDDDDVEHFSRLVHVAIAHELFNRRKRMTPWWWLSRVGQN